MRFRFIPAAIVAALILLASSGAQATVNPAFALVFRFEPAFGTGARMPLYLDVCAVPDCSVVTQSLLMNCPVPRIAAGSAVVITRCSVQAILRPFYPDPVVTLLRNPVNLRIRANTMTSQVFSFFGGQPAVPEMVYNFVVAPGPTGFTVTKG
jgi:hypothetical protein